MTESLTARFGHKIKTHEQLRDIIGSRPRDKKVIMCHGVFDVVHPGHVRHLIYAKSKADILVASITADKHIDKGIYRPHVPQDLRAANLAAYEVVDFVVIDEKAKPLDAIGFLQPDYFAKGYEYVASGMPPKTAEESKILEAYGGEIIFTPGDIIYSSSNLIDLAPPELKIDKLVSVMERFGVTFDGLRRTIEGMAGRSVHVVGDTIIDSLSQCAMIGGQTKTPTMSVLYENRTDFIGGAGIVSRHLRAAGAEVTFSTVLGQDKLAEFALNGLQEHGVNIQPIIDSTRPTTNKNAFVVDGYRLLKVDTLDNSTISDHILEQLTSNIAENDTDAVVFSDFRHGMFSRRTIPSLIDAIPERALRVGDSQVASRWGNVTEFVDFDLITPNEREARFALADQDSGIRPLASDLYDRARCKTLILTLGARGVLTCTSEDHESLDSFFTLDSFIDRPVDAVGSGDALLSYATLALLSSGSPVEATILGSFAAACECERDGNIPITTADVQAMVDQIENRVNFR